MHYSLSSAIECIEVNLQAGAITREQAKELIRLAYIKYN